MLLRETRLPHIINMAMRAGAIPQHHDSISPRNLDGHWPQSLGSRGCFLRLFGSRGCPELLFGSE